MKELGASRSENYTSSLCTPGLIFAAGLVVTLCLLSENTNVQAALSPDNTRAPIKGF